MAITCDLSRDLSCRVVCDDEHPEARREEWRCARCEGWFARAAVILVFRQRSAAAGFAPYCGPCLSTAGLKPEHARS